MNKQFARDGEGEDMPVPATARVVMWVVRFSTAFARCRLRDEVTDADVERAENLAKRLIGQQWDGNKFDPSMVESDSINTQADRKERVKDALDRADEALSPAELADRVPLSEDKVQDEIDTLSKKGLVYQPQTGEYLLT